METTHISSNQRSGKLGMLNKDGDDDGNGDSDDNDDIDDDDIDDDDIDEDNIDDHTQ